MQLVEVRKEEIYCDSLIVARKFNQKHAEVIKRILKLESDLEKLRVVSNHPKTITEEREYRGTKYTAYLMNREFFSLLVMRFKGIESLDWQLKFNQAFYEMEAHIIREKTNAANTVWLGQRAQLVIGRKEETDVIKDFVEYATSQGSTRAHYYYKHITNATYKALGLLIQKKPKLRDTLNMYEISELLLMERYAISRIKYYMELERNYKDIYESVKEDLLEYGSKIRVRDISRISEAQKE